MRSKIELIMTIILLSTAVFLGKKLASYAQANLASPNPFNNKLHLENSDSNSSSDTFPSTETKNGDSERTDHKSVCIVIDAGHGGADPGKVGIDNILEKDLNLEIALRLKDRLEADGITIVLTRETDIDLSNGATSNFKVQDMQNRCKIIADANPLFTISIHQNSYPSEDISGAQVFYYTHSKSGASIADILQNSLIANLDPSNKRQPKANDSYYLLKKTPTPTVIVECGFLTNPTEAALLISPDYQDKIVTAIELGVLEYLNTISL